MNSIIILAVVILRLRDIFILFGLIAIVVMLMYILERDFNCTWCGYKCFDTEEKDNSPCPREIYYGIATYDIMMNETAINSNEIQSPNENILHLNEILNTNKNTLHIDEILNPAEIIYKEIV